MQNCKWTKELVTLGIAVVALANSLAPSKAQAQENFAWITNKNGITWKREIYSNSVRKVDGPPVGYSGWWSPAKGDILYFDPSDKPKIASILVPEHAIINAIDVNGCVNLTNIVIQPAIPRKYTDDGRVIEQKRLNIYALNTDLRNITCQKTMRDLIVVYRTNGWWPLQWTELELELPKMEIRTHSTANGTEVEIVWKEGTLQISDAVNGEYRDHLGSSPLRFPLVINSKDKQFFRIRKGDD